MRLIDADALIAEMHNIILEDGEDRRTFYEVIERQPTIDAVPVIRCKDCKHSHPWYADRRTCELWAETGVDVFNDGFCSYGERKDDGMDS